MRKKRKKPVGESERKSNGMVGLRDAEKKSIIVEDVVDAKEDM